MSVAARRDLLEGVAEVQGRSLWQDARRRLLRNKAAVASMIVLAVIAALALLAPWLSPHAYDEIYWERILAPPDFASAHWFGTDGNGRDLFVRTLYGARVSLLVGILATGVSLVIGVTWGAVAGYFGGRIDNLMMRFVDVMYSLPFMFFVILLMVVFGRHIFLIFIAIGAVEWLTMARIVRGQTLAVKGKEFLEAARAAGVRNRRIISRHVIPNVLGPVVVYVSPEATSSASASFRSMPVGATADSRSCRNSRPIAAPIWAASRIGAERSRRAIRLSCKLDGMAGGGSGPIVT